ncbi:hypothetical protein [Desulfurobacterium sp.]|uniref:hypothetical protein n=1 Tax=Desulfurobacterium sp. TaxID=2004706 RepID=UPI002620E02E|nr:hypothetical protein [Desulfurobacterium sp.]
MRGLFVYRDELPCFYFNGKPRPILILIKHDLIIKTKFYESKFKSVFRADVIGNDKIIISISNGDFDPRMIGWVPVKSTTAEKFEIIAPVAPGTYQGVSLLDDTEVLKVVSARMFVAVYRKLTGEVLTLPFDPTTEKVVRFVKSRLFITPEMMVKWLNHPELSECFQVGLRIPKPEEQANES